MNLKKQGISNAMGPKFIAMNIKPIVIPAPKAVLPAGHLFIVFHFKWSQLLF